jgi:hypothetical protein
MLRRLIAINLAIDCSFGSAKINIVRNDLFKLPSESWQNLIKFDKKDNFSW